MARFIKVLNTYVNIDRIRTFWRTLYNGESTLCIKLDNGETHRVIDKGHFLEEDISGEDYIVQIIPCVKTLYARYRKETQEVEEPIYYLGLCAGGYVRPLDVCGCDGFGFADDSRNYMGLYHETLQKEREREA